MGILYRGKSAALNDKTVNAVTAAANFLKEINFEDEETKQNAYAVIANLSDPTIRYTGDNHASIDMSDAQKAFLYNTLVVTERGYNGQLVTRHLLGTPENATNPSLLTDAVRAYSEATYQTYKSQDDEIRAMSAANAAALDERYETGYKDGKKDGKRMKTLSKVLAVTLGVALVGGVGFVSYELGRREAPKPTTEYVTVYEDTYEGKAAIKEIGEIKDVLAQNGVPVENVDDISNLVNTYVGNQKYVTAYSDIINTLTEHGYDVNGDQTPTQILESIIAAANNPATNTDIKNLYVTLSEPLINMGVNLSDLQVNGEFSSDLIKAKYQEVINNYTASIPVVNATNAYLQDVLGNIKKPAVIQSEDTAGNPIYDSNGNPVYETKYEPVYNADGSIYIDEDGKEVYQVVYATEVDANGNTTYVYYAPSDFATVSDAFDFIKSHYDAIEESANELANELETSKATIEQLNADHKAALEAKDKEKETAVENAKADALASVSGKLSAFLPTIVKTTDENGVAVEYYSMEDFESVDAALDFVLDEYIPEINQKLSNAEDTAETYKANYETAEANALYYKGVAEELAKQIEENNNSQESPEQNPEQGNGNVSTEKDPNQNSGQSDKEDWVPRA